MTFLMSAAISGVTIVAVIIVGIFILIGFWKGLIRSVLTIVVLGAGIGLTALFAPMILNSIASKDYFGQAWLTPVAAQLMVFLLTFVVFLAVFSIAKALILKVMYKLGALRLTNRVLGGALGALIGFFIAGLLIYVYVVILQTVKEVSAEEVLATLDPFAAWMYKANIFGKLIAALAI